MQPLLEFAPLVAFLAAYHAAGLYAATAVLMASMLLLLAIDYALNRRIPPMHSLSAVLVLLFGGATLLLHNQRFIQWKPTVFFWLAGVAFAASFWIGRQTLVQRLIGAALGGEDGRVPGATWKRLNALWIAFYLVLGALNLLVAFNASERAWVNFKVFGLTAITLVFVTVQVIWLTRRYPAAESGEPTTQS